MTKRSCRLLLEAAKYLQPLAIRECPPGIAPEYWHSAFEKLETAISRAEE